MRAPISRPGAFPSPSTSSSRSRLRPQPEFRFPIRRSSSYGRALLVGLVNTMIVSALAAILATLVGFVAGFARLSRTLGAVAAGGLYVETLRNIPLLLQLLFWYIVLLTPLPPPDQSLRSRRSAPQQSRPLSAGALAPGLRLGPRLARPGPPASVLAPSERGKAASSWRRKSAGRPADLRADAFYASRQHLRLRSLAEILSRAPACQVFAGWPLGPNRGGPVGALGTSSAAQDAAATRDPAAGACAWRHAAADQPISGAHQKLLARRLHRLCRPDAGVRHDPQPDRRGVADHRAWPWRSISASPWLTLA